LRSADLTISLRAPQRVQPKANVSLFFPHEIVVGRPTGRVVSMRFAAIADVHGNRFALEAVLADIAANGINEVLNLGDHVSGPLEAARTADLLMERGFPSVLGDQDRRLVELRIDGASTRGDFRQLERKHFDWMASLPPTLVYRDEVFLCHATPQDDAGFWLDYVAADGSVRKSTIDAIESEARGIDAYLSSVVTLIWRESFD
jgi:hypothetical protein